MFLMGESYCTCDECPIGKDEVFRRYERLEEYGDWQPEYCGCDKVDGAHWAVSYTHLDVYKRQTEWSPGNLLQRKIVCKEWGFV